MSPLKTIPHKANLATLQAHCSSMLDAGVDPDKLLAALNSGVRPLLTMVEAGYELGSISLLVELGEKVALRGDINPALPPPIEVLFEPCSAETFISLAVHTPTHLESIQSKTGQIVDLVSNEAEQVLARAIYFKLIGVKRYFRRIG